MAEVIYMVRAVYIMCGMWCDGVYDMQSAVCDMCVMFVCVVCCMWCVLYMMYVMCLYVVCVICNICGMLYVYMCMWYVMFMLCRVRYVVVCCVCVLRVVCDVWCTCVYVCTDTPVEVVGQPASYPTLHFLSGQRTLCSKPNTLSELLKTNLITAIPFVRNSTWIPTSRLTPSRLLLIVNLTGCSITQGSSLWTHLQRRCRLGQPLSMYVRVYVKLIEWRRHILNVGNNILRSLLGFFSVAVKKRYDQANLQKKALKLGPYSVRDGVHCHHVREHGGQQACLALGQQLRAYRLRCQPQDTQREREGERETASSMDF